MGYNSPLNGAVIEVEPTDFLDRLPVYDSSMPTWERLNQLRNVINAFNYVPYSLAFPFGATTGLTFSGLATKEGSLQVPPNSFLLGISGYGSTDWANATPAEDGPGFRFSVTDKGSGVGIAERGFVYHKLITGLQQFGVNSQWARAGFDPIQGPYWLDAPLVITEPGQVQIAMTNLSSSSMLGQVAFHFAYPANNVSLNTPRIKPSN